METRNTRERRSLWLAIGISLLVHAAILFIAPRSDPSAGDPAGSRTPTPRLLATLAGPTSAPTRRAPRPAATPRPARQAPSSVAATPARAGKTAKTPALTAPGGDTAKRTWSAAERAEMNQFLDELATEAKAPSGGELARRGLAMARQMPALEHDRGEDLETQPVSKGNGVDPYSLELYFESLMRKMNRSAAFVANDPQRRRGAHKALVEISLNADGSLKNYRVLRAADQAEEIAYVKSVIERAAPFSAFPRDIRRASDTLSILMCILPARAGSGGGFARSFGDQDCRD